MEAIKELRTEFTRKGWHYLQIGKNEERYLYQVTTQAGHIFYEVFNRKITKGYKESGLQVKYPGDESFGVWAKCVNTLGKAKKYLEDGFKRLD